jgi:hypothetical protein
MGFEGIKNTLSDGPELSIAAALRDNLTTILRANKYFSRLNSILQG